MLTLASLLLVGGLPERPVRPATLFQIGWYGFALASARLRAGAGRPVLIGMRVLQGVGGALLTPGSLAISASFVPADRGRAIGAWSGLGGVATAVGPLLGGYLISAASWRWIFFVNVPVALAVLWLTARHVPESSDPSVVVERVDFAGASLGDGGTREPHVPPHRGARVSAGRRLPSSAPWPGCRDPRFVQLDRASQLRAECCRSRSSGCVSSAHERRHLRHVRPPWEVLSSCFRSSCRWPPATRRSVPAPPSFLSPSSCCLFSARSGRLASRIGPRAQMSAGPVLVGAGLVLMARVTDGGSYFTAVLPGVFVLGIGLATLVAPLTATAMGAVPGEHAGLASAVNNDVARVGRPHRGGRSARARRHHRVELPPPGTAVRRLSTAMIVSAARLWPGGARWRR